MSARRLLGLLALVGVTACEETVTAPGLCPEFCLAGDIAVRDTVLVDAVVAESSFVGYRFAHTAATLQVGGPQGSGEARALVLFAPFSATYAGTDASVSDTILALDSIRIELTVARRSADSGLTVGIYRLGVPPDSATTWASVEPFFADTALAGTLEIPDSVRSGSVSVTLLPSAFPRFEADSFKVSIGLRVTSSAFVDLMSVDSGEVTFQVPSRIHRFVRLDSSGTTVTRTEVRAANFDTFVGDPAGLGPSVGLRVGGLPAARVLLRADSIPRGVVDSTQVIRATLLLVPARAAVGAPDDTFRLRAHALGADFGAKSPLLNEADTASAGSAAVPVGSQDTIQIDVTHVLQAWRLSPKLPRAMMLRLDREARGTSAVELYSSAAAARPVLRLTYVPPYRFPGR